MEYIPSATEDTPRRTLPIRCRVERKCRIGQFRWVVHHTSEGHMHELVAKIKCNLMRDYDRQGTNLSTDPARVTTRLGANRAFGFWRSGRPSSKHDYVNNENKMDEHKNVGKSGW